MAKVSIVLPVYNGEKYVRESIDSILAQELSDWELIIVDDCSTDHTGEIVKRYAGMDSRIKIIHNRENKRLPMSLNIGFRQASGEYLTWTSDDNKYMPNALRVMADYLDVNSSEYMVCADMRYIDAEGCVTGVFEGFDGSKMYLQNNIGACFLYRREILKTVGEYDRDLFGIEDYDYWVRIYQKYGNIGHLGQQLYDYRRHDEGLTVQKANLIRKQKAAFRLKHIKEIMNFPYREKEGRKKVLMQTYYDLLISQPKSEPLLNTMKEEISELACDRYRNDNKPYLIFGAGKFGDKVYNMLQEGCCCYADNNADKVGSIKNGLEIISVQEMRNRAGECQIIVAADGENGINMILQLYAMGIREYCSYYVLENAIGKMRSE